jgi:membrane-associated phospholipid phosphatase
LNRNVFNISRVLNILLKTICAFLVIIIPISRLYVGAHWLTDVIGSIFMALFQTLVLLCVFKIKLPKNDKMRALLSKYIK